MFSQPGPFTWQQVDQSLASSMLSELAQEFGKLNREDLQQIQYQNIGNGNAMTVPSERLQMHHLRAEEWAARQYSMYCEVWHCQQKPLSPEFLRAICPNSLRGLLSARATGIESEFRMEQMRTHSYNAGWLGAAMAELRRSLDRLYSKLAKLAEFDAKSVEYMLAAAPNNPAVDSLATQVVHARTQVRVFEARIASIDARITMSERALSATELRQRDAYRIKSIEQHLEGLKADKKQFELRRDQWQLNLNAALSRSAELRSQATANSLSDADLRRAVDSEEQAPGKSDHEQPSVTAEPSQASRKLNYTSPVKRAIAWVLTTNPGSSDLEICRRFDEDGTVDLPKNWTTGENRFFERAYKDKNHRRKIEVLISRVRTDMRKKGLLS